MLDNVIAKVSISWIYEPSRYPAMAGLRHNEKTIFTINHSGVLHTAKSLAPFAAELLIVFSMIAGEIEAAQHDRDFQATTVWRERMKNFVVKMHINLASVADILGMNDAELRQRIDDVLDVKN